MTGIPVFPAGYAPSPADFGNWIQGNFGQITQGIVFRGEQTVLQALSSSAALNALSIDTVLEDPAGGWSQVNVPGVQPAFSWLVPQTGFYEITVRCSVASAAIWIAAGAAVSGASPQFGASVLTPASLTGGCGASIVVPCYGGSDYIQAGAAVSANVNTAVVSAGKFPSIEIAYLGNGS